MGVGSLFLEDHVMTESQRHENPTSVEIPSPPKPPQPPKPKLPPDPKEPPLPPLPPLPPDPPKAKNGNCTKRNRLVLTSVLFPR